MSHDFPIPRRRQVRDLLETVLPDVAGGGARGEAADEASPAPEAPGMARVLVSPMPSDPHRACDEQAQAVNPLAPMTERHFARVLPLQAGDTVSIQRLGSNLYILGVQSGEVSLAVHNREELRLLRAAITVALGDEA